MAVTLTGAGGLFTRLGKYVYVIDVLNTHRGTTLPTEVEDAIETLDGANTTIRGTADEMIAAMESVQSSMGDLPTAIQEAAQQLLIEMVEADNPQPEKSVEQALTELRTQMLASAHYVDANTLGATATAGSGNVGDGACIVSTKAGDGRGLENLLAEDIVCQCTDKTTAGSEDWTCRGEVAEADRLSHNWPQGSGGENTLTAIDSDSTTTNLVTNGNFETTSATNVFSSWTYAVGSTGTHIAEEGTTIYAGSKGLRFIGDGATLTQIYQALDTDDLEAKTPYAVCFWARMSAAPGAGILTVDLHDGTSVINDEQGTANSFTVDLTTLGTTFVAKSGVFRLPEPIPSTVRLRLRLSTALSASRTLYIDHLALGEMTQVNTAEPGTTPFVAFFSGATNWSLDDTFTIATTNDRASLWQQAFDKLFNTAALGFVLPVSGVTLINDNLIA